jgi:hypothetical protein
VGVDATTSEVEAKSTVNSYVLKDASLNISGTTLINADNNTLQYSEANSNTGGLIALGFNKSTVFSSTVTHAYIEGDVTITGESLDISATGIDNNNVYVKAGSGGLVAGSASNGKTTSNSATRVDIATGTGTKIDVGGNFKAKAEHNTLFRADSNSITAALVGGSGANVTNDVTSDVNLVFGPGVDINAGAIDVDANNIITKVSDGYNVVAGSGGLAGGRLLQV